MVLYRTPCSQHTRVLWHCVQHEAVTRRSPWPAAFPPCPPPAVSRSCSGTSRVLCSCSTPRSRASRTYLPWAFSRRPACYPAGVTEVSRFSRMKFPYVLGLHYAGPLMLALSHHPVLPSPCVQKVGTLNWVFEALYLARKCLCLRLRAASHGPPKTRGQDGSLLLSCETLSFPTSCRFIRRTLPCSPHRQRSRE